MQFLGYEQITVSDSVLDVSNLTVPANTTFVEIQSETQNVRYILDGDTEPTVSTGMVLLVTEPPKFLEIEDLNDIKFIRDGGSDAALNVHYGAARNV